MPKGINRAIHLRMFRWLLFNNIFMPLQILAASTVFFCPIPETKKMMGDGFLGATAAGLFWNSKRLLSTSCNKQGQRSSE